MNAPLVLAFNMSDIAKRKGIVFDIAQLSELLEAAIVPTVGNKGKGRVELLDAVVQTVQLGRVERTHKISYAEEIETELASIESLLAAEEPALTHKYGS
jgi:ferrous iron transport protein B